MTTTLTPVEIVSFEAANPGSSAAKNERIEDELEIPAARYFQLLGHAVRTKVAIAHDAATCRLVRERQARRSAHRCALLGA